AWASAALGCASAVGDQVHDAATAAKMLMLAQVFQRIAMLVSTHGSCRPLGQEARVEQEFGSFAAKPEFHSPAHDDCVRAAADCPSGKWGVAALGAKSAGVDVPLGGRVDDGHVGKGAGF